MPYVEGESHRDKLTPKRSRASGQLVDDAMGDIEHDHTKINGTPYPLRDPNVTFTTQRHPSLNR